MKKDYDEIVAYYEDMGYDTESAEHIAETNRIQLAVNRRVFWELGREGFAKWSRLGYKDYGTLARAYGIC